MFKQFWQNSRKIVVQAMSVRPAFNVSLLRVQFFINSMIAFWANIVLSFVLWTDRCTFIVNIAAFINLANQSPFNNVGQPAPYVISSNSIVTTKTYNGSLMPRMSRKLIEYLQKSDKRAILIFANYMFNTWIKFHYFEPNIEHRKSVSL